MRIIKQFTLLIITMGFSFVYGQEDKKPDFYYEVTDEIKNPGYFSFEIDPLLVGYKNYYISLGVGGGIRLSNLNNKISAELKAEYIYSNYSTDKNQLGFRSIGTDNKKFMNLEGNFGYTMIQNKKNEIRTVRLRMRGNTETVAELPCDVIRSYIARAGFITNSFHQRGEVESVDPNGPNGGSSFSNGDNYEIFQTVYNVSVGAMRKISVNTHFKTTKFGNINESADIEIYADVLINVANKFPQVNRLYYNNSTYPNEITDEMVMDYEDQNYVREQFFKLPVGIRLGTRQSSYKIAGFFWNGEIGLYPGSYSGIFSAASVKIGFGYKFQNNFK